MITFAIIGGGWRAEFYLRIAKALPELFRVSAICVRNPKRAKEIKEKFDFPVVSTVQETLKESFDFIVNCINKDDISDFAVELADQGHYVLSETPIIKKPEDGHDYRKIQVAEQFHRKGYWQTIKKILDSGLIGEVNHINISVAHDYHAMSLIRFLLHDFYEPKLISESEFKDTVLRTHGRNGVLDVRKMEDTTRVIKIYQFPKASVVYDYNKEQYFSPIRKNRILIRGTKGEIADREVRYLNQDNIPVRSEINTEMPRLMDGLFCDSIIFENQVLFVYPFHQSHLSEEEHAIAECLIGMKEYMETGKELYSYEKAYQDYAYFNL